MAGPPFRDRRDAGRALAQRLAGHLSGPGVVVLGLPRGGVPVAAEVAAALGAALDVFVVRKLGVPGREELAMGAVASGDVTVRNEAVLADCAVPAGVFAAVRDRERAEVAARERAYRGGRAPVALAGRTVILVDDGLATGASMRAAVAAVRRAGPARLVVAVPVGAPQSCAALAREADELVCLAQPPEFLAVGAYFDDFRPTGDAEVRALLAAGSAGPGPGYPPGGPPGSG